MQNWLIDKKIRAEDFNIWDKEQAKDLDKDLQTDYAKDWKVINDNNHEHRFFSTPWNHWMAFLHFNMTEHLLINLETQLNQLNDDKNYWLLAPGQSARKME